MVDAMTVDANDAPQGRRPVFLGADYVSTPHNGRYYTEAWSLTDGELVVIVRENGGTSLMNASERIAEAIDKRWYTSGIPIRIIEDWGTDRTALGHRFVESSREGGHWALDFDEWDSRGLVLPR